MNLYCKAAILAVLFSAVTLTAGCSGKTCSGFNVEPKQDSKPSACACQAKTADSPPTESVPSQGD